VESAAVGSNDGLSSPVVFCIVKVVRSAQFTGTGRSTTLSVPVTFLRKKR
jgi:hypothetical protein